MRAIPLVLLLAGCATISKPNVSGNELSVVVNNVWNANEAFASAQRHCEGYGRVPKLNEQVGEYAWSFDCVKP